MTTEVFHFEMLRLARFLYETIASSISRPSLMSTFPLSLFPLVPIFSKIGDSYGNIIVTFCTSYAVGILNCSSFGGYPLSGRKNNIIIFYIYLNYLIGMVT